MRTKTKPVLPIGLAYHCEGCGVVIPSDAPNPDNAACAWVVANKMSWFDPNETIASQHTMATAAWALVHHKSLTPDIAHPESITYLQHFKADRKSHFVQSAVRKAMTPEQVAAQSKLNNGRDAWLYGESS
jgi:hypothetical protein